jgi:putative DNA primase/helicase
MYDNIPDELKQHRQWCLWRLVQTLTRLAKHPFQPNGTMAKVNDATTWNSYEACVVAFTKCRYDGLGFIFTEDAPFCGIDFDHVIDDNGCIENWARIVVERLNSYTEVSQSGTGLHVLVRACSVK